jgi:NADH-quinone oxidoreductase subunit C
MPDSIQTLAAKAQERFGSALECCIVAGGEVTLEIAPARVHDVCLALRDEPAFRFELLIDLCGVDYLTYGDRPRTGPRFAVVYHLLSVPNNQRIRIRCLLDDAEPRVPTVVDVWASANWYEREAFDLFGILFDDHPDLRRLLTDYGFVGHPFRKDFPLSGNVEMRYDPERRRVIYEPVTIEPRINVPRVIRHDHRYLVGDRDREGTGRG